MKKLYFLLFTLLAFTSYGQNLAANGGFETWNAGAPDGFTTIDFSTNDLTENTNAAFVTEGTSSASVNVLTQSQGDTDIRQNIALIGGTTYTISLDVYATNNEARARIFNGNGFDPSVYSDETILNEWQTISFEYTPSADEDFVMGIRFYDISANWNAGTMSSLFYIDNLQVVASIDPNIVVTSPADGSTVPTTDVDVVISVQNFNVAAAGAGDGYIQYSVDGGTTFEQFDTMPLSLTNLAEGDHTVNFELVDNNGQPLSPAVTATVTFTVSTLSQVATIADLRAGTLGEFYELTGEALISYIVTDNTRNQKYIQDATGGILIDDTNGTLNTALNIGDGITGLQGQLSEFSGVLQFIPSNAVSASSTGNTITPEVVTVAQFLAASESYESELIQITGVTFEDTGVFADNTNYNINGGTDVTIARVTFGDENLVGANIPTTVSSVIGLGAEFNGTYQILPRYVTDVEGASLSVNEFDNNTFSVYPNPTSTGFVTIVGTNDNAISVSVYDILGKQVINKMLTNNRMDVSALNAGLYIVKISQNNASVTKKLVIK